jgi:hypothetical protein
MIHGGTPLKLQLARREAAKRAEVVISVVNFCVDGLGKGHSVIEAARIVPQFHPVAKELPEKNERPASGIASRFPTPAKHFPCKTLRERYRTI